MKSTSVKIEKLLNSIDSYRGPQGPEDEGNLSLVIKVSKWKT